jgi:hypothetical protein
VIQHLDLPAILDGLIENAEFVADAVARGRDLQGGQRIEVARGETAEAAIAQTRLFLLFQKLVQRQAQSSMACWVGSQMPRLTRLLPSCGPMRNSAER